MKLNIGCGAQVVDGWLNLDERPTAPGAGYGDIRMLGLRSETFDVIAAHHVLDLLPSWVDLVAALKSCRDVIEEGGLMRISCADPRKMIDACERGDLSWFVLGREGDGLGQRAQQWWAQRNLFLTPLLVGRAARSAGWSDALTAAYGFSYKAGAVELDSRGDESFFVDLIP